MNSGTYTFKPLTQEQLLDQTLDALDNLSQPAEPEPAPTVSLYNLLDHSAGHLSTLHIAVKRWLKEVDDEYEPEENPFYSDLKSWNTILKDAVQEKNDRDSEAWAETTAKEINETL